MRPAFFAFLFCLGAGIFVPAKVQSATWPGKIELPTFPKPDPAHTFADLKIYNTNESPIRMPVEDWPGARLQIATDIEWQKWETKRRSEVDDWMLKRHDQVGWIAGWHHNFVSPKDGTFLTFTPDEPGEETLSSPSDSKVKLTPQIHAAWVCAFRMRNADMMIEAAQLFRLTGDVRYAKWAAAQIDFYADNFDGWKVHDGVHFMFQSLDEAVILAKWVATARTLDSYVDAEQKKRWSKILFKPEAKLLEKTFQVIHNIACWQRSAEAQVALYCNDDKLWRTAVDGRYGIRNQIARGVTSDYIWFEQSLGYNAYVVKALVPFFENAMLAGKGPDLQNEMETGENLLLSPLYMRFPNGQLPNPADAGKAQHLPSALLDETSYSYKTNTNEDQNLLSSAWQIFPTKLGLKLIQATHEKSWELLLDPPNDTPVTASLPTVNSCNLESSRMAIIRSGSWQVFFHYGQLTGSHCQAEALNFEAFYNDVDITHDPGTAGYGSKLTADYFRSGVCHNVPLVDGVGQKSGWVDGSWNPGKLESFNDTNVVASQPEYRLDAHARRSLMIDGEQLRDDVTITTTDGKQHALGFVLNLQGKVKLPENFTPDAGFTEAHPAAAFKFWQTVQSLKAQDQIGFDVGYGDTTIHVEFKLPGKFTISHALAPDYPPDYREAFYLETQGTNATLTTIFSKHAG